MRSRVLSILVLGVSAVMAGALALIGVAYVQQSERVDELEGQNEHILGDHTAIGKKFAQQSKMVEAAVRASYGQGFSDGQRARGVPTRLSPLARYASLGMLVPHRIASDLDGKSPKISTEVDGYAIRWRELALFASASDPLRIWTRQSLGGVSSKTKLGSHTVTRMIGPNGVIYAWRENGSTYALIAVPRLEPAGRSLISSMR